MRNIKNVREKLRVRKGLSLFQREFRKHLSTFITGAFAFVAALLWRDAVQSFLSRYEETIQSLIPLKEAWVVQTFTAFVVSVIAVVAVIVISKTLGVNEK